MTNRRSFFKLVGLAAGALTAKAAPVAPESLPPLPAVRSKKAYVTSIDGHDWTEVTHGLGAYLVCAVAGGSNGPLPAEVESIDSNRARVRVPKVSRGWFSWARRTPPGKHRLIVYVPA